MTSRIARVVSSAVSALAMGGAAVGAEIYVQPQADALVEVDTNRNLSTTSADRYVSEGYGGEVGATLGIATPTSDSTIRGRLGYVDYPKDDDHELQGTVDLANTFTWQRSEFSVLGQFDRMNTFSSELASATFNPIVPISPTTPETGRLTVDTERTMASLQPRYDYRLTQRLKIGVSAIAQTTDYTGTFASDYTSFNYGQASVFADYSLTPRLDLSVGPYISRDAPRGSSSVNATATNGVGAAVALNYKLSTKFSGRIDVTGEGDTSQLPGATSKIHSNAFGASYTSIWNGQLGTVQASIGRTLTPSGSGGEYYADQLQVEYDRKFSQRLSMVSAVRLIRYTTSLSEQTGTDAPYKYVDATVALKWLMTRTWYLNGGVEFLRLDFGSGTGVVDTQGAVVNGAANNGRLFVGFGYEGLGKRQ